MANALSTAENRHQVHPKVHFSEYLELDNAEQSDFARGTVQISPKTKKLIDRFLLKKHRFGYFKQRVKHFQKMMLHKKAASQGFIKNLKVEAARPS